MNKQAITVYQNLHRLLDAGVPLLRAIDSATTGFKGNLVKDWLSVKSRVENGSSLSAAMSQVAQDGSKHINAFTCSIMASSESAGRMDHGFKLISEWAAQLKLFKQRIISGLIYPVLLLHAAAVLVPLPNWIMGNIGGQAFVWAIASYLSAFYLVAVIICLAISRRQSWARPIQLLMSSLPIVGSLLWNISLHRFFYAFYYQFEAGVPIEGCLRDSLSHVRHSGVYEQLKPMLDAVQDNRPSYEGLNASIGEDIFAIWQSAEVSGMLNDGARRLCEQFDQQLKDQIATLSVWLPRIVYCLVSIRIIFSIFSLAGTAF